jgi:hypothetical protein
MQKFWIKSLSLFLVMFVAASAFGQTFRGTLSGTIVDVQGAVVSGATVKLTNPATALELTAKSSASGEFLFPELPVGVYQLTITDVGFQTKKIDNIDVAVSKVQNLKVELAIGSENTVVDVNATGVQTDTTSSSLVAVIDSKEVKDMPMNGRNFTQMIKFTPSVNISSSVNGSRTAGINYQVDGTDNNDPWSNAVASNQGGIAGLAGGLIPIEAIDQFSMATSTESDTGRNAGANSNMVLKSGTNQIHGDAFYFNRNEFFAAISPVAAIGSRKPVIRNNQGGFTLGGPLWKNHTFLFLAGEFQIAKANSAITTTALNDGWISAATSLLKLHGLTPNPVTMNIYKNIFQSNNWFAQGTSNYNSYNSVIKLDQTISNKQQLSLHSIITTGRQTAPGGSNYAQFYQTAPMHIFNFSVVHTYVFNSHLLNQVNLGTDYFLQTFNDATQNYYPAVNDGLNLGITNPIIAMGAPTFNLSGFEYIAATQPLGRTDVTGTITDSLHWTIGKHNFKFGGEFRHTNINVGYYSNSRGTFAFNGSRGPWTTADCTALGFPNAALATTCTQLETVADFVNGQPQNTGSKLLQGNIQRVYLVNTEEFWGGDGFQVSRKLNLNYGIRWSIPGVVHDAANDLYSFNPTVPGFTQGLYNNYYGAVGPRGGFSYSVFDNNNTVLRGSFGIFYDLPSIATSISGTTTNGGASYTQNNPAGPSPAVVYTAAAGVQLQTNVNPFTGAAAPTLGGYSATPNFREPYLMNYSLGVQQQFSRSTMLTLNYVGSQGRRLPYLADLNQPIASALPSSAPYTRPFAGNNYSGQTITGFFAGIDQVRTGANSNYNGLQASLKQSLWHGITFNANYTWARSMDTVSSTTTPSNSYNLALDYGPSTYDTRNTLNGFVTYNVPKFTEHLTRLTNGWQANALFTFSGGTPISPTLNTDNTHTNQFKDRPNVVVGVAPYLGRQLVTAANGSRSYKFMTSAAFAAPALGIYGNERRDQYYGPGLGDIDFSLFKHTPITEKINTELRAEVFNMFNQANFANPSVSNITSGTFGTITNTRNASSSPGLGFGEPFNVQFGLKVIF